MRGSRRLLAGSQCLYINISLSFLRPSSPCRVPPSYPLSPLRCLQNLALPWHRSTGASVWLRVSGSVPQALESPFSNRGSSSAVPPSTPGSTASALSTVDATIFAHEFINIFRFSHRTVMHPADIRVIDPIDDDSARYEEENGTVFLSRDVMERFSKLTVRRPVRPIRQSRLGARHAPRSSHAPPPSAPAVLTHLSYPVL